MRGISLTLHFRYAIMRAFKINKYIKFYFIMIYESSHKNHLKSTCKKFTDLFFDLFNSLQYTFLITKFSIDLLRLSCYRLETLFNSRIENQLKFIDAVIYFFL